MDIEKYLTQTQSNLEKSKDRIKDFSVFDFNYIPEKLLMREEVKPVINALLRYQQTGIANNLLILGSRGCGKSVLAKFLMKVLSKKGKVDYLYINCRFHNTSYKILSASVGVRPRGFSLDELWQKFTDSHPNKTVFIIDEVDLISEKDRNKDILYLISRSENNVAGLLLSNNPKFLNKLDESIKSTLQPEVIHFKNYNALEIEKILTNRAIEGLNLLPKRIIREIAAMTAKNTNSDIRISLKTLYLWALEPEVSLKEHFEKARRDIMFDVVKDLNDKNILILKAALCKQDSFVKDIYQAYKKISTQFNEEPFSYVHFYSNLSYLQSLGLILLISTKVNRTYTNRIQLTFDPGILSTVLQMRFG